MIPGNMTKRYDSGDVENSGGDERSTVRTSTYDTVWNTGYSYPQFAHNTVRVPPSDKAKIWTRELSNSLIFTAVIFKLQ